MGLAMQMNQHDPISIIQLLVLKGAPVLSHEFNIRVLTCVGKRRDFGGLKTAALVYMAHRKALLAWAKGELSTHTTYFALILGCGVHASFYLPPAQRNQLMKLRGDGQTDARIRIARCLGVNFSFVELGRLKAAAEVWGALEGRLEEDHQFFRLLDMESELLDELYDSGIAV